MGAPVPMHEYHTLEPGELARFVQRTKASSALPEEPDVAYLFRQILGQAGEMVPSEAGSVLLDDPMAKDLAPAARMLHYVAAFGPGAETLPGRSRSASSGLAGQVYCTGKARLAAELERDTGSRAGAGAPDGFVKRTLIAAPIVIGDSVCGAIELANRRDREAYDVQDLRLLEVFASYTASTIQNALDARHAQQLARMDDLTGLFNDRYLHVRLRDELAAVNETGAPCALLFIDLDRFKPINDRYGHLVGSQVLREVAFVLRRATADLDAIVARYGGDEFAIVLPGHDAKSAEAVAETVRAAVADAVFLETERPPDFPALNLRGAVTASIGVAAIGPGEAVADEPALWLIRAADEAMYQAKSEGKDRVARNGR